MNNHSVIVYSIQMPSQKSSRINSSIAFILFILFYIPSICEAQDLLSAPQKIVIDRSHNRLLVSNYNTGDLIEINSSGIQDTFVLGADFVDGMEIVGNNIYGVGSTGNIRAYDLETKQLVMNVTITGSNDNYLSSVTSDSAGHLFISCPQLNTIYKFRLSDQSFWVFAINNGLNRPNGILLEKEKNRIVVIDDSPSPSIIHAISLLDSTVSTLATTTLNSPDGIVRDKDGSYYVGGYYLQGIYKIDSAFSSPPSLFYAGNNFVYPTYDASDNSLLVTLYNDNSWLRISLEIFDFISDYQTGHAPLTVQFNDMCNTLYPITSWNWDFENDGVFDSDLQNPIYEYSEPGTYTVRLQVTIDTITYTVIKEDYIGIFDGMSAVKFIGDENYAYFPAIPPFNLTENFTIELVAKQNNWGNQLNGLTIFDKSAIRLFITGNVFGAMGDYTLGADLILQNGTKVKLSAPNNSIKLDTWQHIAISYNASLSQFKMYINGVELTVNVVGLNQPSGVLINNENVQIILGNNIMLSSGYEGVLDEFRLWSVIRTGSDILENMDHSLTGNEPGLIGYWQMDEGNGTELIDISATGNYGHIEFAAFAQGVDLSTITELDQENNIENIPQEFILKQNYPNPFNPSTTITYQLVYQSYVKIIVTNILGETVSVLVNGIQNAGIHEYRFDAADLSSGIYYYQLAAGNYRVTKKMMLIR